MKRLIALLCLFLGLGACCTIPADGPLGPPAVSLTRSAPASQLRTTAIGSKDEEGKVRGLVVSVTFDRPVTHETADQLISVLDSLPPETQAVVLVIDSGGGDVRAARRIVRALDDLPALACVVDGDGASAAYFILQACPLRLMTPRSTLLIHEGAIAIDGDPAEARKELEMLEAWNVAMASQMCGRLTMTLEDCTSRYRGRDWWVNVIEAKEIGAVDGVVNSPREVVLGMLELIQP